MQGRQMREVFRRKPHQKSRVPRKYNSYSQSSRPRRVVLYPVEPFPSLPFLWKEDLRRHLFDEDTCNNAIMVMLLAAAFCAPRQVRLRTATPASEKGDVSGTTEVIVHATG